MPDHVIKRQLKWHINDGNFGDVGINILKNLAEDIGMIDYNFLFFKTANPRINNFDFI